MIRGHVAVRIAALALVLAAPQAGRAQINQGQVDTFETGTTLNWMIGSGPFNGPTTQPGGPGGGSDNYLQLISGQLGGPPNMTIFNQVQWTGNYNIPAPPGSNPVNAIELDIANFSATQLSMRVVVKTGPGAASGYSFSGGAGTGGAIDIPADGGQWHRVVFPINTSTMTAVNAPPPLAQVLDAVAELRILHSVAPAVQGSPFVGRMGVDNIRAVFIPVPEPASALAVALAGAAAGCLIRRRRIRASGINAESSVRRPTE